MRRPARSPACRPSRSTSPTTRSSRPATPRRARRHEPGGPARPSCDKLEPGGTLIVNVDAFDERNLTKAGYDDQPARGRQPQRLHGLRGADDRRSRKEAVAGARRQAPRRRAVEELLRPRPRLAGCTPGRSTPTLDVDRAAVRGKDAAGRGQHRRLQGRLRLRRDGRAVRARLSRSSRPRSSPATYTNITGNTALAWGLVAAGQLAKLPVFLGSYPITPASDILHELSKHKNFGVRTFQAEDEIAGVGAALGAAFGGHLGVTTTSGPGRRAEGRDASAWRSASSCRCSSSTSSAAGRRPACPPRPRRPTCCMAMYGRHGESPLPIVAAKSPSHCFDAAIEAARIAIEVPHAGDPAVRRLPRQRLRAVAAARRRRRCPTSRSRSPPSPTTSTTTATRCSGPTSAIPRPWPAVGDPGHARPRCTASAASRRRTAPATSPTTPPTTSAWCTCGPPRSPASPTTSRTSRSTGDDDADLLVLGWGSTWGAIDAAVGRVASGGQKVAHAHLVHLNPFPANLGEVLRRYRRCSCPR